MMQFRQTNEGTHIYLPTIYQFVNYSFVNERQIAQSTQAGGSERDIIIQQLALDSKSSAQPRK